MNTEQGQRCEDALSPIDGAALCSIMLQSYCQYCSAGSCLGQKISDRYKTLENIDNIFKIIPSRDIQSLGTV